VPRPGNRRLEDLPEILTVDVLVEFLGYSRNTVYSLLKQGAIRAVGGNGPNRFIRSWRVSKKALWEYLDGTPGPTPQPEDSP